MSNEPTADLSLFFDILQTLERYHAPYMIIGAFAATLYGSTRVTYDIDLVVDLKDDHIRLLSTAYPPPRYYADADQMRDSAARGLMFNIIDTNRGEKADLLPLTPTSPYRAAFNRRIRQTVLLAGGNSFEIWCARFEDVIIGKLLAWAEGRSRKHEQDIYEMLLFRYLDLEPGSDFDEAVITRQARQLGPEVNAWWQQLQAAARRDSQPETPTNQSQD